MKLLRLRNMGVRTRKFIYHYEYEWGKEMKELIVDCHERVK